MAQKNTRIDDVKPPEKVTPSATSRPILVSSQPPTASDPMMVSDGGENTEGEPVQVMSHTAKTITPLSEAGTDKAKEEEPKPAAEAEASSPEPGPADANPAAGEEPAGAKDEKPGEPKPDEDVGSEHNDKVAAGEDLARDPDAALSAAETAEAEARVKREQELEELIAGGKYAVPINAVQWRRSRMHSLALALLALLLTLALLDAVADVGLVGLPSSVPHTHFFSGH